MMGFFATVTAFLLTASVANAGLEGLLPLAQAAPELPEPSSVVLLAVGAVGLFGYAWRQRHRPR